jgi:hypothetical protein
VVAAGLVFLGSSILQGEAKSQVEPVLPMMSWEPTEGLPLLTLTGTPGAEAALTFRITLGDLDFAWSETVFLGDDGGTSKPLTVPDEAYLHGDAERYFTWLYVQGDRGARHPARPPNRSRRRRAVDLRGGHLDHLG